MKLCRRCNQTLPLSAYTTRKSRPDGHQDWCRMCHNAYARNRMKDPAKRAERNRRGWLGRVQKLYGLTPEQYIALIKAHPGCAICGRTTPGRRLSVDHDHTTGAVRGLLCVRCNRGIAHFLDDPMLLDLAAAYLRRALKGMGRGAA